MMNKLRMERISLITLIVATIFISGCVLPLLDLAEDANLRERHIARKKYVEEHPGLDERTKKLILDNKIGTGMTKEQVNLINIYDWRSHRIEPTSKYGADEVWIYKDRYVTSKGDRIKYEYLYFKGDILVKIEEVKTDKKPGFFD